ncbi:MAG: hypothetical protein HRU15_03665 [Planctomycetes bacterium]|nr:hypothetical protein [Planctomycetota bacterium]
MVRDFWKCPSYELAIESIDRVSVFKVKDNTVISEEGWPNHFWNEVSAVTDLGIDKSRKLIECFGKIEVGEPARCHIPPWGFAAYSDGELLFTTTICYKCDNVYIYTGEGKTLRAFNSSSKESKELYKYISKYLRFKWG